MNRRNFLRTTSALSVPALLQQGIAANPLALFSQFASTDNDNILVLIRLSGGNDGLNTVIGLDQLENLRQVRGNIALPDDGIIGLNTKTGLHGAMTGMHQLFNDGKLGIVQAAGYPNQNRSHFRSTDIWTTASAADEVITTGWLGRYLELDHPDYPTGYPNDDFPYPLGMTMGNVVSETCQGQASNFSVAVNNPFNYLYIAPGGDTPLPDNFYGDEVSFVRNLIGQSNTYGSIVQEAAEAGDTRSENYTDGRLSPQLRNIATLISGGLGTKVYIATLGGFDTHSGQTAGDNTTGVHAGLLQELSDSIKAFMEDLELLGVSHRVLGMTFSEFGRRIRSNESNGSDHGDAAPLFLFGDCVQGGVLGDSPEIDPDVAQNVGVPMQYDFRDIYGSILVDWFEVPTATVQNLINGAFTYLPIAGGCNTTLPVNLLSMTVTGYDVNVEVAWQTDNEIGNRGFVIERSEDGRNFRRIGWTPAASAPNNSVREYNFRDQGVSKGNTYYYRLKQEDLDGKYNYSPVKVARLRGTAIADWAVGLPRPNPVNPDSYIKVYAPTDATATFELIDISGRKVRTGSITLAGGQDNRVMLRPGGLAPGTYVWRLSTREGKQFARKLIVNQ
ncbi:DUF1501 domain-containing protein [Lewinella sp. W8]|uniref:DUF1501 domain-containing protein n=1 Tax=Lewinella sp. W8 TaxID=2528208 RepID=UPI001068699E|nr:DUF1501 domain-containing protein [Lewinella sp. W8]MTB53779.1 DUF1501 domain-containing protein [Lewinella sp. W8]